MRRALAPALVATLLLVAVQLTVFSSLRIEGVVVIHSATPESWNATTSHLVSDLAPGRPLHADTWSHLLAGLGFGRFAVTSGGEARRLDRVAPSNPDASAINGAIEVVNELLLGPGEYLVVAVRER